MAVLGAQWGDEGKGKIIDYLTGRFKIVARFQGEPNAGHTVQVGNRTFKMHHLPVGILRPGVLCLLGNGMVINPIVLVKELDGLQRSGIDISRVRISEHAHVILPFHEAMDNALENQNGGKRIGTTGLGIGPAYADKAYRRGLRMMDFVNPRRFRSWLEDALPLQNSILKRVYGHPGFKLENILEQYLPLGEKLAAYVDDVSLILSEYLERGEHVLFEGAQGTLLDLDHGTYPYVTSSSTIAGGIATGLGISPHAIGKILGVIKAYTTRVGEGPFPTEELGEVGEQIRATGGEYGTTTGRPRRCGWFDAVIARYSARVNGFTGWCITKLDVLSGFQEVKIATAYNIKGDIVPHLPTNLDALYQSEPVYEVLPGWEEDICKIQRYTQLPPETRNYLQALEDFTGVKVVLVSVGPEREQTFTTPGSFL